MLIIGLAIYTISKLNINSYLSGPFYLFLITSKLQHDSFTFLNNQMFQAMENKQDNKSLQILFW